MPDKNEALIKAAMMTITELIILESRLTPQFAKNVIACREALEDGVRKAEVE